MHRFPAAAVITLLFAGSATALAQKAPTPQPPELKRTVLQTHPLSIRGRDGVMVLAELPAGGVAARHTHPGDEMGYVLEGVVTLELQGQPARTLKAGDVFFIPAGTPHIARNNGTVPLKLVGAYVLESGKPLASPAP